MEVDGWLTESETEELKLVDDNSSVFTHCRMYEQTFPQKGDFVIAHIDKCEETGASLSLPEYDNATAMIYWSDATRKRVRSVHKLLRKGHFEVMSVLRTDEARGYIDLSRRELSDEDKTTAEFRYQNAKIVHSILSHVAVTHKLSLLKLYTDIGWPLYRKYGHACDAFAMVGADERESKNVLDPLSHDVPLAAAALQFSLRDPRVDSTIIGISRPERVAQTLALASHPIPAALWTELEPIIAPEGGAGRP